MKKFIFSCEHGGNKIPFEYNHLFEKQPEVLRSHEGWDIGILEVAKTISNEREVPLFFSETTRLLVELNRSLGNPQLFSRFTASLSEKEKDFILLTYYYPYRKEVESKINELLEAGNQVIHISFHSFTPVFNGQVRSCDIGLLFDPAEPTEQEFCSRWQRTLSDLNSELVIKHNFPYQGVDDGFTTYLRTKLKEQEYSGIELEVNQKHLLIPSSIRRIATYISHSLANL